MPASRERGDERWRPPVARRAGTWAAGSGTEGSAKNAEEERIDEEKDQNRRRTDAGEAGRASPSLSDPRLKHERGQR